MGGTGKRGGKSALLNVSVNDGLHLHGIMAIHPGKRMIEDLDQHFISNSGVYQTSRIQEIDVRKITDNISGTTKYVLKALKRGSVQSDHILILPRSISEMTS